MSQDEQHPLEAALDQATPVPAMPAAISAAVLAAFPARKPLLGSWTARVGALAATVVLGFGGVLALQSYQTHQRELAADADAFAEQLLSENY